MSAPGRTLNGRYQMLRPLGTGGMGSVWLARDLRFGREVALKALREYGPADAVDERRRRAAREANALAALDHPAVVKIHDVFWERDDPWIVMEYLAGRPLAEPIADGPVDRAQAARIGLDVLGGLEAAHAAKIMHRDVKPANIIVEREPAVLVDFGLAWMAGASSLTATNTIMGTPEYMAPERFADGRAGPASDLWSLAVTLFHAIEGYSPFRKGDQGFGSTIWAVMNEPAPEAVRAGPLAGCLAAFLHKDPESRPPASAFRNALRDTIAQSMERPGRSATRRLRRQERVPPGSGPPRGSAKAGPEGSAAREAADLAVLPPSRLRDALLRTDPAKTGMVLLALPRPVVAEVLSVTAPEEAASLLTAMSAGPVEAARALQMLAVVPAARILDHMDAPAAGRVVAALVPVGDAARILARVDPRAAAAVLQALPHAAALGLVKAMREARSGRVLGFLPPEHAARLLRDLDEGLRDRLLTGLDGSARAPVRRHLHEDQSKS
ncbi:serine/threonine protein kinase [Actinocorallia herbida]|uniref:non-specific serine/threonine protein kinase n=1 Tax=Actinocorallia herbida TaxID=58109 RepID=A0A3N1CYD1_9ACTN|nr:protein kinase [Actinocorallia herbida]ROO86246.1 serine/threonine protein kinase [Actinocorallia herbida]